MKIGQDFLDILQKLREDLNKMVFVFSKTSQFSYFDYTMKIGQGFLDIQYNLREDKNKLVFVLVRLVNFHIVTIL